MKFQSNTYSTNYLKVLLRPIVGWGDRYNVDGADMLRCIYTLIEACANEDGYPNYDGNLVRQLPTLIASMQSRNGQAGVIANFYKGFYYQLLTHRKNLPKSELACHLTEASHWYMEYLTCEKGNTDLRYYAQLQIGLIKAEMGSPWDEVQQAFLQSFSICPHQAEGIKRVMQYYMGKRRWATAYIFSSFAKAHFLGKAPKLFNSFALDPEFYAWRVLDMHIAVCCQLGKREEAESCFKQLWQIAVDSPPYFQEHQLKRIFANKDVFEKSKIRVTGESSSKLRI